MTLSEVVSCVSYRPRSEGRLSRLISTSRMIVLLCCVHLLGCCRFPQLTCRSLGCYSGLSNGDSIATVSCLVGASDCWRSIGQLLSRGQPRREVVVSRDCRISVPFLGRRLGRDDDDAHPWLRLRSRWVGICLSRYRSRKLWGRVGTETA